ncbi:hypothetical protein EPUS_09458 [Endocarpon pusillum Z07020]|uniref:Uncharacterized protein n=1 Tax=Endocarpon pusillum (strain Z07020 / HMAS-L-300199) TaxID=1263415 RepID=U1G7U1_ENDPU|nr:uncharacterized protein EPUS_09458 [Endocarpon pusillum Z07020]ERF68058.1 hypothetical protein EPUS_09458 [Endocarpon pusillum Z07020]
MPSRTDRTAFINRTRSASRKKTTLADHTDEQESDCDAVPAGTERGLVVKGPDILGNMWDKAGRAGRVEVMREVLYDMISALRARQKYEAPRPSLIPHGIAPSCFQGEVGFSGLAGRFQALREELEISNAGEQLYRLRRRVALAQFYNDYTHAQADPYAFLYPERNEELSLESLKPTRKRKRTSWSNVAKRRRVRLSTLIHNRVVDLMFPGLILSDENIDTEEGRTEEDRAERAEKVAKRQAASQKVQNWRANGKPWSALTRRFDWGILLLLPTDLLDQNLRMMKEATLSCFFDALDFFFTDSGRLLPNATALVPALLSEQPPSKKLRLEYELPRYGRTDEDNHQYFGELLEPCEITSCSNEELRHSTPHSPTEQIDRQLPCSDLRLRPNSGRETSPRCSAVVSPHVEASDSSKVKTTVIVVDSLPSNVQGQSGNSILTRNIAFGDKFVSPHHFEDALYGTSINTPDTSFNHDVELADV